MKKYIFILLAAMTFVACSEDEETNDTSIQPVKNVPQAITDFFTSEMGKTGFKDNFFPPIKTYDDNTPLDGPLHTATPDTCCIINNMEELATIYNGDKEFPNIDFSTYSLIVGKATMPYQSFQIKSQSIKETELNLILNIKVKGSDTQFPAEYQMRYWGLYPKLPNKPLVVNIIQL